MPESIRIPAIKIHQWFESWGNPRAANLSGDGVPEAFYCFSISAAYLRALTGVHRRSATGPRADDQSIQRRHDPARSLEISRYLRSGMLLAPSQKLVSDESTEALKMPGWLPTALVVNILVSSERRNKNQHVHRDDCVTIQDNASGIAISLPASFESRKWEPKAGFIHPIEVIDGQHRLWAFNDQELPDDFELPVVAFFDLAIRWQAYLFWSINVKPRKINPSLAYDLYPILRRDQWLTFTEDIQVYRDARAQEIVEGLWSLPASPFRDRINMIGSHGHGGVTQAAWIRSLTATFIKSWTSKRLYIGGLFGASENEAQTVLPWNRAQQTAFLIFIFNSLFESLFAEKPSWLVAIDKDTLLEQLQDRERLLNLLFSVPTLLTQDQGIRPILNVYNDMLFLAADRLELYSLFSDDYADASGIDPDATQNATDELTSSEAGRYVRQISKYLATYDWRSSTNPTLSAEEKLHKQVFRGSGGYRVLRLELLKLLEAAGHAKIASSAKEVLKALDA